MHKLTRSHLAGGHRGRHAVVTSLMAAGLLTGMMSVGGLPRANAAAAPPLGEQLGAPKAHTDAFNCGPSLDPMSPSVTPGETRAETGNGIQLREGYDYAIGTWIFWVRSTNGRNSYALQWTDGSTVYDCNDNSPNPWTPAVNQWFDGQGHHRWFRATDLAGHYTDWVS